MKTFQNKLKHSLAITTVAIVSAFCSVTALAFDDKDEMVIENNIATLMASMDSNEMSPIIDMMPPKMFGQIAALTGLSNEDVKEFLIDQSNAIMQQFAEDGSSMSYVAHFDKAKIMQTETGRDYVLIPTEASMIIDGMGIDMTGTLLALEDGDHWYMLRIDGQQHLDMLENAYPDMTNIEVFEPTMEEFEVVDGIRQKV